MLRWLLCTGGSSQQNLDESARIASAPSPPLVPPPSSSCLANKTTSDSAVRHEDVVVAAPRASLLSPSLMESILSAAPLILTIMDVKDIERAFSDADEAGDTPSCSPLYQSNQALRYYHQALNLNEPATVTIQQMAEHLFAEEWKTCLAEMLLATQGDKKATWKHVCHIRVPQAMKHYSMALSKKRASTSRRGLHAVTSDHKQEGQPM